MNEGFVPIYRKILNWEWITDSKVFHFWVYCLLKANHKEKKWHGKTIKPGQFITSLPSIEADIGLTAQSSRTCINKLKSTGEIINQSTNRNRMITVVNWAKYRRTINSVTGKIKNNATDNQQASNRQATATNNE